MKDDESIHMRKISREHIKRELASSRVTSPSSKGYEEVEEDYFDEIDDAMTEDDFNVVPNAIHHQSASNLQRTRESQSHHHHYQTSQHQTHHNYQTSNHQSRTMEEMEDDVVEKKPGTPSSLSELIRSKSPPNKLIKIPPKNYLSQLRRPPS
ncbi:unnamed protein product [Lepeophtheirus salmonis]|uniref:(salmon louse) hypothetical protein n=1 Tax=Lepeophtheirus salmonis TaxID=72036 RepID=A0A7R8HDP1_LEPSM|nr:unnamed protein product [Lepeophtheirus salmonis]CAF3038497.1 unnamed protein product [Lepeophtheirus salmonis]